jgi:hypothetical protein
MAVVVVVVVAPTQARNQEMVVPQAGQIFLMRWRTVAAPPGAPPLYTEAWVYALVVMERLVYLD